MHSRLTTYLRKRGVSRRLQGDTSGLAQLERAIVVPALAESAFLPATLASVAANPPSDLARTLVVVVVNNRPPLVAGARGADPLDVADNQATLRWLSEHAAGGELKLAWIDASSPGLELPPRGGVGLARKLGVDSVLRAMAEDGLGAARSLPSLLILHLDADTLVEPTYLAEATQGMHGCASPGGVVEYAHQPASSPRGQWAIDSYELYLRYYVEGLRWARSPYAFHTVGSTMVCTADGYARAGGISAKRQAGEDFYFLQELQKAGGVATITSTTVHPSARPSPRVPFGTGPRVSRSLDDPDDEYVAYDPRTFGLLRDALVAVETCAREVRYFRPGELPEVVRQFLDERSFPSVWSRFLQQHRTAEARMDAFHCWLDGLATVQLIHRLSDELWPRVSLREAWNGLLEAEGVAAPGTPDHEFLSWCRGRQRRDVSHCLPG